MRSIQMENTGSKLSRDCFANISTAPKRGYLIEELSNIKVSISTDGDTVIAQLKLFVRFKPKYFDSFITGLFKISNRDYVGLELCGFQTLDESANWLVQWMNRRKNILMDTTLALYIYERIADHSKTG